MKQDSGAFAPRECELLCHQLFDIRAEAIAAGGVASGSPDWDQTDNAIRSNAEPSGDRPPSTLIVAVAIEVRQSSQY